VERKSRSRELRQELAWSFGISALRVSGNGGGSALGSRVSKDGKVGETGGKDPCQRQRIAEKTGGALVSRRSQALLTVSGFRRLESHKSCIRIREVAKSEILNRTKSSVRSQPLLNTFQ
jgi:hypothetical protein